MDWRFRHNWDEFAWEREIRKDELRISRYFKTLPGCLDLPGEDEMIFRNLMAQPELVPTGVRDPRHISMFEFQDSDDEDLGEGPMRRRGNLEALRRLEALASDWNLLVAAEPDDCCFPEALAVTCAFGKLLARILNLSDIEEVPETVPLRISLAKRILSDINELSIRLEDFRKKEYLADHLLARFLDQMTYLREAALDLLGMLRGPQKPE